jgi:hypothetical protein
VRLFGDGYGNVQFNSFPMMWSELVRVAPSCVLQKSCLYIFAVIMLIVRQGGTPFEGWGDEALMEQQWNNQGAEWQDNYQEDDKTAHVRQIFSEYDTNGDGKTRLCRL